MQPAKGSKTHDAAFAAVLALTRSGAPDRTDGERPTRNAAREPPLAGRN